MRFVFLLSISTGMLAFCAHSSELDNLKKEVESIRSELQAKGTASNTSLHKVDESLQSKYSPNVTVSTKVGKLEIGGLVQVWYQHINNDSKGIVAGEPNSVMDNDTFRVRRTELRFLMDVHENITAYVMIDPAREANLTFTPAPTFASHDSPFNNPALRDGQDPLSKDANGNPTNRINPQLMQDAYLNFHGIVPHHDFTIGQFKPPAGEEAWRNSGQLEFIERALVTSNNNVRDIGVMVHGTWLDNRVQYWAGAFNGPTDTTLTDPETTEGGNRSDDNDRKDFVERLAVRPLWDASKWYGRLELGGARTDGVHGESGSEFDPAKATNGLNRQRVDVSRSAAWVWYRPGHEVRGWWLRGEYGNGHDLHSDTNLLGIGTHTDAAGNVIGQLSPTPVTIEGWYFGTGYKLSDSRWAEKLKAGNAAQRWLHDLEFAFRYEVYQNIAAENIAHPDTTSRLFKTQAYTAGVNWYLSGHNSKVQANYVLLDDPSSAAYGLRKVNNDQFLLSFQVMF